VQNSKFLCHFFIFGSAFDRILVGKIMPEGKGLGSTVLDFLNEHILEIYFGRLILNSFHFRKCLL
jgi:hypothetical protein